MASPKVKSLFNKAVLSLSVDMKSSSIISTKTALAPFQIILNTTWGEIDN